MTIKHLVICGGGPAMIQTLGSVYHLETNGFINLNDIETIYGTSAGGIIGVFIALKFDWETINDYIIKRPWQDVFPIKVQNILDAYTKKGIYDNKNLEKCFKPVFDAKDIQIDINLNDFYTLTKIELHFFSFEINEYKLEDISYLTHPNISVITAIQMTMALPILVSPICIDGKCYLDGGLFCNYPMNYCIESGKQHHEILGFKNIFSESKNNITKESTLLEFLISLIYKAILSINKDKNQPEILNEDLNEVICESQCLNLDYLKNAISSVEVRKDLFDNGVNSAKVFLKKINYNIIDESCITLDNSIQELN